MPRSQCLRILAWLVVPAALSLALLYIWQGGLTTQNSYVAVIDAGSSGSRLLVYQSYPNRTIQQMCMSTVEPGLNSFGSDLEGAWKSLHNLIQDVRSCVKAKAIPVHLYATGGVRKLSQELRSQLCNHIIAKSAEKKALLPLQISLCTILSGEQEAYYGWLAVNYLAWVVSWNNKQNGSIDSTLHPKQETMGALDLGGESFEIAYEPIFHSYSLLGANAIRAQLLRWLQKQSHGAMRIEVTCFPVGYEETEFGNVFYGSGDLRRCRHQVAAMLEEVPGYAQYCSLQLPTERRFYGMSLLFYVADYLAFVEKEVNGIGSGSAENTRFDSTILDRQLQVVHALPWKELTRLIGSAHRFTSERLLPYRVIQGVYVEQLLRPLVDRGNAVFFVKTVHRQNVDWSLGAALSKLR